MGKKASDIDKVFKGLEALNPFATYLDESTLSCVDTWFDTGCYVLNAIMSGSLYKGVPEGRVVGFSGVSQSGKTFITNKILASAQKQGRTPVIFDTESAIDRDSVKGVGLDPKNVKYVPVVEVEKCRNQLCKLLDDIVANNMQGQFIICIDSLGNLVSSKELSDIDKDKDAADMGTKAKALKSMLRALTMKAAMAKTTVLFTNHTYDNPGEMHPSSIKTQSGGSGPIYLASILVQLDIKLEKGQDVAKQNTNLDAKGDEVVSGGSMYTGQTIKMITTKNRFIPPFMYGEAYLSQKTGLKRRAGLHKLGVDLGVITGSGHGWFVNEKPIGKFGVWKDKDDIWEETILPAIEIELQKKFKYNAAEEAVSLETDIEEVVEQIDEEVEE